MSKLTRNYASKINLILKKIIKEEEKKFIECAKLISKSYKKGGQLYIFGTGHSRLLGEESFHRAGG
ncbi:SIS domain-containing protein, partial [bacterium]|nr:SIS domain-containing protein [bacterium]